VWGAADDDVWIVGIGCAFHWDGTTFREVDVGGKPLLAVSGTASDDVWAVGGLVDTYLSYQGVILHWDGSAWSTAATSIKGLTAVHAAARDAAWAVGSYEASNRIPHGVVLRWDGSAWATEVALDGRTPADMGYVPGTGVGDLGYLLAFPLGNAVWASSPADVYVVGDAILHQRN
jgi:hypothetical protein